MNAVETSTTGTRRGSSTITLGMRFAPSIEPPSLSMIQCHRKCHRRRRRRRRSRKKDEIKFTILHIWKATCQWQNDFLLPRNWILPDKLSHRTSCKEQPIFFTTHLIDFVPPKITIWPGKNAIKIVVSSQVSAACAQHQFCIVILCSILPSCVSVWIQSLFSLLPFSSPAKA